MILVKIAFGILVCCIIILEWRSSGLSLSFIVLVLALIGLSLIAIFKNKRGRK